MSYIEVVNIITKPILSIKFYTEAECQFQKYGIGVENRIWVRSRRNACPVTWFCYNLIKPGNKTAPPSWPDQYDISMAMEMDKIELMVELQVFTHIHDQRVVHRQFIPDTQ